MQADAIGRARVRQLQLATGGRYKPYLVEKIVLHLKTNFLEELKRSLTLNELLIAVSETEVSDEIKDWLINEALPNHQRVKVIASVRGTIKYSYAPPIRCSNKGSLLKLLRERYEKPKYELEDEIGILRSVVDASMSLADRVVTELLAEGKITKVTRLDNQAVLFYKKHEPDLEKCVVDNRFVELWNNVDVANKEISHIREYLKNRGLPIFKVKVAGEHRVRSSNLAVPGPSCPSTSQEKASVKRKTKRSEKSDNSEPKPKRKQRIGKIKDNVHVQNDLMEIRFD